MPRSGAVCVFRDAGVTDEHNVAAGVVGTAWAGTARIEPDLLVARFGVRPARCGTATHGAEIPMKNSVAQVEQTRMVDPGRVLLHAGGGLPVVVS